MYVLKTLALLAVILTVASAKPSLCAKKGIRVAYGQRKTLTSPELSEDTSCKWKIKAPDGLHIRFTFSEFEIDPCCSEFTVYDAERKSFRWKSVSQIASLSGSEDPGYSQILPTSKAAVKYNGHPTKSRFSLTLEAVIPEDGDCGFEAVATSRSRSIGTPGFPKAPYPNNLRCTWTIRPQKGHLVSLDILKLKTQDGPDFLEVYDGDVKVGEHTGTLGNKETYVSFSGALRVVFHSDGSVPGKGFKAKYIGITPNSTVLVTPSPVVPGGGKSIKCYDILSSKATVGPAILDQKTEKQCDPGFQCMRIEALASTAAAGVEVSVTTVYGACMPELVCSSVNCGLLPNTMGVEFTSCNAYCCATDFCNDESRLDKKPKGRPDKTVVVPAGVAPDETDLPRPKPSGPVSPPAEPISCYTSTIMSRQGVKIRNSQEPTQCGPGYVCALVSAISSVPQMGNVDIMYGSCAPAPACGPQYCDVFTSGAATQSGPQISDCSVSCCNTNLCNEV